MLLRLMYYAMRFLPKNVLSRWVGQLTGSSITRPWIRWYARRYTINKSEAEMPIHEYKSLKEFFTRRLKEGLRSIDSNPNVVVSPVDGTISQVGTIREGEVVQAKGDVYTVADLLGDQETAQRYEGGSFITLYLSPSDYHRIHMPLTASVERFTYIPGSLYPVNRIGLEHVKGLFTKNERLITYLITEAGRVAMVKVGAFIVGSVRVHYDPYLSTNFRKGNIISRAVKKPISFEKGEEIGYFEFGSTVILLFEKGRMEWLEELSPDQKVCMGERIALLRNDMGSC